MSRIKNASKNIVAGFINKIITLLLPFLVRSVIIQSLGSDYLGLNSLFTSILQVLNLAELGFSSAVVYSMYEPIAKKDTGTICALINLYKKVYRVIGIVVLLIGLILLPFLPLLIKGDAPSDINIYVLYIIYLLNTASTYFLFAYKSSLFIAHQRNDIVSNVQTVVILAQYAIQIIALTAFKNFYLFVSVQIATNILSNIIIAIIANKKYPEYNCRGELSKGSKNEIRKKISGLMINKVCHTTRNSIDSICISSFLGLGLVTIYSNYYTIIQALIGIMGIFSSSIVASVGNSIVTESEEKNYKDMKTINFMYMWGAGWITICLVCLYQSLMKIWMGEEYLFSNDIMLLFAIYFYALEMGVIRAAYSDARGLWYENRHRAIAESIVNVLLNVALVQFMGIYGIIIGTLASLLIINFGYGSQILFKHYFKHQKPSEFYSNHAVYAFVTAIVCAVTFLVCSLIKMEGVMELIVKGGICFVVPNILYLVIYSKTQQLKDAKKLAKKIIKHSS